MTTHLSDQQSLSDQQKKAIISLLFAGDPNMTGFLFEPAALVLRDRPPHLLMQAWEFSHERQVLIRAALDMWSGLGNTYLNEILHYVSDRNFSNLIAAIQSYRDLGKSNLEGSK
jgi:hypothetical protein